jgi:hypothetical protein
MPCFARAVCKLYFVDATLLWTVVGSGAGVAGVAVAVAALVTQARSARKHPPLTADQPVTVRLEPSVTPARSSVLRGAVRIPADAVRVSSADPRLLGVHEAISVPRMPDERLPEYVPRDADYGDRGVRARVAAAAEKGGFVLLVGGSSVGKTRSAYEAITALLPDWWLVHPDGPAEIAGLAAAPARRMVMWLDELQRYLDGTYGLTGGVIRKLLNAPHPVVIIATIWPDLHADYTAARVPGSTDPHGREKEVLGLARVVRIEPEFSKAEKSRARDAASRDGRLAAALSTVGYGVTQSLAAAPQLVSRWQDARGVRPYAWAVLTAAMDAARLGARAPLNEGFLRAAAPGYCTPQEQASAPANWFEQAMAYAKAEVSGAASALAPEGAGMGQVAGYRAADYLIQYATGERKYELVPATTWDAMISHVHDSDDADRLAESATKRLLYRYAIPLYRRGTYTSGGYAARQLGMLLGQRGDMDEAREILRPWAEAGDWRAAHRLRRLFAEHGDMDQAEQMLCAAADAGEGVASQDLAKLLAQRGDAGGLRARADAGDGNAAEHLAELLTQRGDLDQLRARAAAGDSYAAYRLAELLAQRGDLDDATQVMRARVDAGDEDARWRLAKLLAQRGDMGELRARADAGDYSAAEELSRLLAERGELDELRARADAGDSLCVWRAATQLADLLADRGDLGELRARADAGDDVADGRLSRLLADRGELDELRARADAGRKDAAFWLGQLIAKRGNQDELEAAADGGDATSALELARQLIMRGELDRAAQRVRTVIRAWWDVGDYDEAQMLAKDFADLLSDRGALDQLRIEADGGSKFAAYRLAQGLAEGGDLDGAAWILQARADAGDRDAPQVLAPLLADAGNLQDLLNQANAGDGDPEQLVFLLVKLLNSQGRGEEAERLRRFGLNVDGSIAKE